MEELDKNLKEATSNVKVENKIDDDAIEIIKSALIQAKKNGKSFLTTLYEIIGDEKNERKNYNRR